MLYGILNFFGIFSKLNKKTRHRILKSYGYTPTDNSDLDELLKMATKQTKAEQ